MSISFKVLLLFVAVISISQCLIHVPLKRVKVTKEIETILREEKLLRGAITNRLINIQDGMFLGQIQVGKSKQSFDVVFDSGSSIFWVPSSTCQNCRENGMDSAYTCTLEDGCKTTTDQRTLHYGTGIVDGNVTQFEVSVPNTENISFIGLLISKAFGTPHGLQGLVGLGPTVFVDGQKATGCFILDLYFAKQIEKPILSFFNAFASDEELGKHQSAMTFGGVDESKIVGDIEYFQIGTNHSWSLVLEKFEFDNSVTIFSGKTDALIDTGATSFFMRPDYAQKFFDDIMITRGIKIGEQYEVDCNADLPVISLTFRNVQGKLVKFDIEPLYYLNRSEDQCQIIVQGALGGPTFVIGNTFLRKFMPIFNYVDNTVGFARTVSQPDYSKQKTEVF